jgi:ribonuclease Y
MEILPVLALMAVVLLASINIYFFTKNNKSKPSQVDSMTELQAIEKASEIAKKKILEAEKKADEIEQRSNQILEKSKNEVSEKEKNIEEREKKIIERSKLLDNRFDSIGTKENELLEKQNNLKQKEDDLKTKLEEIAQLTREEARKELETKIELELKDWTSRKIRESENEIKEASEKITNDVLLDTLANSAVDYVADTTITTIAIKDESIKSRIIGKNGRNVKTFEKFTGVDVIIDDETPNEITISCFDPIRREVAALAMDKLVASGKINPAAIEEMIEKVKKDLLKEIKKTGEDMAYEAGLRDIPNELIMLLGRFKYRFSYGQNLVKHTLEMIKIGEQLAKEVGADVNVTKLACLLHDIGKVMPQEGKQHHHISAELARKYYPNNEVLANAIEAHHFDIDSKYVEAEIVRIADAISGGRPGARKDSYEDYVKRIRALEDIAVKYPGVDTAFAIKAGREVRVIVRPMETSDEDVKVLAYKIAREIEETQGYPGVIKVNVIREYRVSEEAK